MILASPGTQILQLFIISPGFQEESGALASTLAPECDLRRGRYPEFLVQDVEDSEGVAEHFESSQGRQQEGN